MGGCTFFNRATGKDAKNAFLCITEEARYESGHGGYSGTIAEKSGYLVVTIPGLKELPTEAEANDYANKLINEGDERVDDKWGPAGCIEIPPKSGQKDRRFLFFGWASS